MLHALSHMEAPACRPSSRGSECGNAAAVHALHGPHTKPWGPFPPLAGEPSEAVVLDVRGMKCGGCSAAVKRILLQQPHVLSAAVNLLTETAVVTVAAPQGEPAAAAAAQALSDKGFPASLRSLDASGLAGDAAALSERKEQELRSRWAAAQRWRLWGASTPAAARVMTPCPCRASSARLTRWVLALPRPLLQHAQPGVCMGSGPGVLHPPPGPPAARAGPAPVRAHR